MNGEPRYCMEAVRPGTYLKCRLRSHDEVMADGVGLTWQLGTCRTNVYGVGSLDEARLCVPDGGNGQSYPLRHDHEGPYYLVPWHGEDGEAPEGLQVLTATEWPRIGAPSPNHRGETGLRRWSVELCGEFHWHGYRPPREVLREEEDVVLVWGAVSSHEESLVLNGALDACGLLFGAALASWTQEIRKGSVRLRLRLREAPFLDGGSVSVSLAYEAPETPRKPNRTAQHEGLAVV